LKREPYRQYMAEILKGNTGDEYAKKTIEFLQKQDDYKRNSVVKPETHKENEMINDSKYF
jgi:hypothetical protein